ncbi:MAG: hypothetical protein QOG64_1937 [Acidimicrobiaceae bacterium]|nr:hypothetical protein [Acidimicrobiaceae bacterium]
MPQDERPPATDTLTVLQEGDIEIQGRMPWSSNSTFLVTLCHEGTSFNAIYKPHRGERPLWDFPDGLYRREAAAYELSEALGWGLVPETIVRDEAPFGQGSLQRFVEADFEQHYFTLLEEPATHDSLRAMCAFDLLANNADRKSGHCLHGAGGRIWGIDHGLCFHDEPKLRTVIWDFAGESIADHLLADIERLAGGLPEQFDALLSATERKALVERAAAVVRMRRYPDPGPGRPYPWPLV